MKKLNITKEQFEKSRYFNKKYGKLEYVSESGKVFKTSKGKVLMFKESETSQWIEVDITWGSENDSLPDTVFVKTTLGKMPSRIELECELEETYGDQILHVDTYPVSEINPSCDCFICAGNRELTRMAKQEIATMQESSKKFDKKFVKENNGIYEVNEIDDRVMGAVENALNNAQDCFADELEKQGFRGYDGDSGGGFYFNDRRNKKTYYVRIGIADLQECDDYEG